jgi:hypothetical protein
MLGNDLPGIHGVDQTYKNLKFTLENEPDFPDTEKGYVLNRIVDIQAKDRLKKLLSSYNVAVWDLPFETEAYDKLPHVEIEDLKTIIKLCGKHEFSVGDLINKIKLKTHMHNLYVVNNNGCRNKCIELAAEGDFDWCLPFDSNSYFTASDYDDLHRSLLFYNGTDVKYNIVPQYRLSEGDIPNDTLLSQSVFNNLKEREPQICFKSDAPLRFNKMIPYGCSPKAELLRALDVPGPWCKWKPYEQYGIMCRNCKDVPIGKNSRVYRLNSYNAHNDFDNNNPLRVFGLLNMMSRIQSKDPEKRKRWFGKSDGT